MALDLAQALRFGQAGGTKLIAISFSALDFATDAKLRAALRQETVDATVFIVSQRIGTVMHADRIVVLDNGRVAGIGSHRELLKTSPVYREIVESQLAAQGGA